jgi:hypothetical protein
MLSTSPLNNKVISIYNYNHFNFMYRYMLHNKLEMYIDGSGTLWHIKDVCKILLIPKKKAK